METALQRTPDGAAELGCALTPSGPLPSRGLHAQAPRRSLHRGDAAGAALASTAGSEIRRLRAGHRDKARRALSPPVLGSRCGVNCFAIQHNGLLHARPAVVRKLTPAGHARNPRYVLRPLRACAGHRLGVPSPCPANTDVRAHPEYRLRKDHVQARCARSHGVGPRPPSAPEGAPGLSPLSLLSVAPCSPRQGFAAPLRALDPAARGAP